MKHAVSNVSERRVCGVLSVPRSAVRERSTKPWIPVVDEVLAARLQRLITLHPTFGYRRLWALLRFHQGLPVNRKAVYRVLVLKGWFVHQRRTTPRPRVQGRRSRAPRSNERWAMDLTHIDCGADGWAHLAAVIDCPDRELVGYEFARRGGARRRPSGRSRPRASSASARCGRTASPRCCAVTMDSSFRAGAFERPARTTDCVRSSSRLTPQSRTGSWSASFGV